MRLINFWEVNYFINKSKNLTNEVYCTNTITPKSIASVIKNLKDLDNVPIELSERMPKIFLFF